MIDVMVVFRQNVKKSIFKDLKIIIVHYLLKFGKKSVDTFFCF